MTQHVDISFDCVPLRSVGKFDIPIDASPEYQALCRRIHLAAEKHGVHNAYYLCNARCAFHLTNDEQIGLLDFRFEGTALTDAEDRRTLSCDLSVELAGDICPWLTTAAVEWFAETVHEAVKVEFDRYIAAGDLGKTIERLERLEEQTDQSGGFMGMGL
jgi:hypothetical protein